VSKFLARLEKYNKGLKYYTIQPIDNALQEDGKYGTKGYGIVNNETGVVEHTTICLPAALFQATHFDDMLASLLENKPELSLVAGPSSEDVVPSNEIN
jgi:hypothetical protein